MSEWHPAAEEYCETIFELGEDHIDVVQARIAERLGISRAAVSLMIKRLERDELIEPVDGKIALTVGGRALAEQVVRRHRLAERFLTDLLHLSWAEAHHEAGKWEHVISPRVEEALVSLLDDPTTCPHGNPIPGSSYEAPSARPLVEVAVGDGFVVERIPEALEFTDGLLEYLEEVHMVPGRRGHVVAVSPDGTVTVDVAGTGVGIGAFAAERILVS